VSEIEDFTLKKAPNKNGWIFTDLAYKSLEGKGCLPYFGMIPEKDIHVIEIIK
jgi:hypothetical protein